MPSGSDKVKAAAERVCFVVAPIGEEGTPTRDRSDQVFEYIISPVVAELGYRAVRADKVSEPGMINDQVIKQLLNAPLVVADLTERNPNVFYELAVRHATHKPTIQLMDKDEKLPFDVSGMRVIKFNWRDLRSSNRCREELSEQIRAAEQLGATESPLSQAVNLLDFRHSGRPVETAVADLTAAINQLSSDFQEQQQREQQRQSELSRLILAQGSATLKVSRFRGLGSGTFSHGLGTVPDLILLQPEPSIAPKGSIRLSYSAASRTTVHVESDAAVPFSGVAVAFS